MTRTGLAQRYQALDVANEHRTTLVMFRAKLRSMSRRAALLEAARVLREEPESMVGVRVHRFLEAVPGLGEVKTRAILRGNRLDVIWPLNFVWQAESTRQHCSLTERQLERVADGLEWLARQR